MKYRFITILHNLVLEGISDQKMNIFDDAFLSNESRIKDEILDTFLLKETLGFHSSSEFDNTTYLYIDGILPHIVSKKQMDEIGNKYTFLFLRKAQAFAEHLWKIKDNNIYIRDGFLVAYESDIEEGFTYKGSLSAIYTKANKDTHPTIYSKDEIFTAAENFTPPNLSNFDKDSFGGKYPSADHFFKSHKYSRTDRAQYFILSARANITLPIKIVMYCTALECLFTTGTGEITHKIAERIALIVGKSKDNKMNLFKLIKKAYGQRSTIVHGSVLKGNEEDLEIITKQLDELLRKLITENNEIFEKNEQELDTYFTELLFQRDLVMLSEGEDVKVDWVEASR